MNPAAKARRRSGPREGGSPAQEGSGRLSVRVVEEAAAYRRGLEEAFAGVGHRVAEEDEVPDLALVALRVSAE